MKPVILLWSIGTHPNHCEELLDLVYAEHQDPIAPELFEVCLVYPSHLILCDASARLHTVTLGALLSV